MTLPAMPIGRYLIGDLHAFQENPSIRWYNGRLQQLLKTQHFRPDGIGYVWTDVPVVVEGVEQEPDA